MKVKSDDRTIADVLTAYFLRVPRFQRPYEWTDAEVEDFWDDIAEASKDYFIGSMVFFPSTHGAQGIVDGQQRITTITLLLCALRDALRTIGKANEADGLQNLVERRSVLDNKQHFVLRTDEDSPYLRHIQSGRAADVPAATVAERRLRAAHVKLVERIRRLAQANGSEGQHHLLNLRDKVLNLRLITIEVDNEDDATVIFQTLNSRGRDLESADLVKSHLLSILSTRNPSHDPPREKWNNILSTLAESKVDLPMDRFLLHSWLSRREYLARTDLGKTVRKRVRKISSGDAVAASTFLDELVTDARLYREIHEPGYRSSWQQEEQPLRQAFDALQLFRVRQPLPWLLALWREYENKELRQKHVIPAVQAIERFHFIATAVTNQPSSGGVSKMYASHARQLTDAANLGGKQAVIADLREKLTDPARVPTRDQFSAAFAEIRSSRIYTQQQRLALYILQRLQANSAATIPDWTQLTVEHIDPQGAGQTGSAADTARLGNLLLVPRQLNGDLGNKPFGDKREALQQAADNGVFIDPYVLEQQTWAKDQIVERTQVMAKQAYDAVWAL
jgi:hypothetical protein